DVGPVVDDDNGPGIPRQLADPDGRFEQPPGRRALRTDLQEPRAAGQIRGGEIRKRPARAAGRLLVQDGAKRADHTASASGWRGSGRPRKRSTNEVLTLPAAKSGSFRIRRWRGIVVLIPSMTVISSVRRMRAMASWRSRPWTMILAIIES